MTSCYLNERQQAQESLTHSPEYSTIYIHVTTGHTRLNHQKLGMNISPTPIP